MNTKSHSLKTWLLWAAMLPAAVQAQLTFTTNYGAITITGYNGNPGVVVIPSTTNGYPVTSIASGAFTNKTTLTRVTIPDSVTNMGDGAFYQCTGLTNAAIGNGVIRIGNGTFNGCTKLTNATIGTNVASIGNSAFFNCSKLTSITIPASVTNIEVVAFQACGLLTGIYFQGNAPSLGLNVFYGDTNTTVYYLPGTSGWSSPFGGLPAVMLNPPDPAGSLQVTLSPAAAITNGARWLVDGGVPQPSGAIVSGLSVGHHTVSFSNLNGWVIPASQSVAVSADSTNTASATYYQLGYVTNNGAITITGFIGANPNGAVVLPGTISGLPVTEIGSYAFLNRSFTNVTIPSSVTYLWSSAFQGCNRLTGIYFQGNAPGLGSSVFYGDYNATVYYLPGTSGWGLSFGGCPAVMLNPPDPSGSLQVTLSPAGITNRMRWQVDGGVEQPSGAIVSGLSVGNHTVSFSTTNGWATPATQIVAVDADPTATAIGSYCQLTYITNNGAINITGHTGASPSGAVVLPGTINGLTVTAILPFAFQHCASLTGVTVPNSVTNIYNNAFSACTSLTNLMIGSGVISIAANALSGCASLAAITVDTNNAIYSSLAGVLFNKYQTVLIQYPMGGAATYAIPNSVITITNGAFLGCSNLTGITIGTNVLNITGAFNGCSGLTTVAIPDQITVIGNNAFRSCSSLTNVTIGSNVATIEHDAFSDCSSLTAITVDPANPFLCSTNGAVFSKDQTVIVQFPCGVGGSYTIPQGVTTIGGWAFATSARLNSVTIPDSVITIGTYAFINCGGLTNVTIGSHVTAIEDDAFNNCSSLTSITIPDSVITIGAFAFLDCGALTNVAIGTNVTDIGEMAFAYCRNLTSITIPDSVISIGVYAFYVCTNLTRATIGANVSIFHGVAFPYCNSLAGIYFRGNAPSLVDFGYVLTFNNAATVYYLPWTSGWPTPGEGFGGCPTALWLPQMQTGDASFGMRSNQFGFNITWASDMVVVVEACTNLANPDWTPIGTNTLTGGSSYFSDSQCTNYPGRFYRLRSPYP